METTQDVLQLINRLKNVIHTHTQWCFIQPSGLKVKWMELVENMLSKVSQVQKDKDSMFFLICGRSIICGRKTYTQTRSYTNLYVEHVCNSGITLWNASG
jgi:hypothetical protein